MMRHHITGHALHPPWPPGMEQALFAMGCFWGAERLYWQQGVYCTAVGYVGGHVADPDYRQVCTGSTGHAEAVLVVHDPDTHPYATLLQTFWEGHDPTQGDRQGNDIGSQYRSVIFTATTAQAELARQSCEQYQQCLNRQGPGRITTALLPAPTFYYAEDYHQQYLARNPGGYCGLGGTGIPFSP